MTLSPNQSITSLELTTPLGAWVTIKPDGKVINIVYKYDGKETVYRITETKQLKLVMGK